MNSNPFDNYDWHESCYARHERDYDRHNLTHPYIRLI